MGDRLHKQQSRSIQQQPDTGNTQRNPSISSVLHDFQNNQKPPDADSIIELQRYIGNQAIQRLLSQNGDSNPQQIQRSEDSHGRGCSCPECSGRISRKEEDIQAKRIVQRADEHEEDIQAKRIVQRVDEHEEDIQAKRIVQREGENEAQKTVPERLEQLKKKNLKTKLTTITAEYNAVELADLMPHINSASISQKKAVWDNKTLMTSLEAKLSADDYLNLLPALGMFQKGKTAEDKKSHTRADKADKYIRKYLGDRVKEAAKNGASVEGQVAVVSGTDWLKAYNNEFGNDGEEDITNAFVDAEGRIWVHKDRGNAGTIIHEGVHKYAQDTFLTTVGFNFNEGITEYYTRLICDKLKYKRGNYQSNWEFSKKFADYVGEASVTKAYFDGDVDSLKQAFENKGKDWDTLVGHVQASEWSDAADMLN